MDRTGLTNRLAELRQRLILIGMGKGIGWGIFAAAIVFAVGAWADLVLDLEPPLRIAAGVMAAAATLVLVGWFVQQALRFGTPPSLARALDRSGYALGEILAGIDLYLHPRQERPMTAALADVAITRAESLVLKIVPARVVPTKPVYRAAWTALASLSLLSVVAVLSPRLAESVWLRFTDPFGDHPPYSGTILSVEPQNARVIYGSGLDVFVTAEGTPVDRVELVLHSDGVGEGEVLPMFPESDGRWRTTVADLKSPATYMARTHSTRSHRFRIDVVMTPRIEQVRFRITPPTYTNQPTYEGPLPAEGLAGLTGTTVKVVARSNRPLASGSLDISADDKSMHADMTPGATTKEVNGTFSIHQAGRMHLTVRDTTGELSREPFTAPISLLTDDRPMIRIVEPPPVSLATPNVELPVVLASEDDYGISKVDLFRSLNESRPTSMTVAIPSPPEPRLSCSTTLPLAEYGLEPGDVIRLFGRAEDNDPGGPKGTESAVALVRIISESDYQRMMLARRGMDVLQSKYQQARRRMEALEAEVDQLSKELEKSPADSEVTKNLREKIRQLGDRMKKEAEELAESAKQDLPLDIDRELKKQLEQLAKDVARAGSDAAELGDRPGLTGAQACAALANLKKQLDKSKKSYDEEAMKPLEHLAKIYPLMEDQERFVALYQRQRDLADRLASLKGNDEGRDPSVKARMRDLELEQKQLRDALDGLLDDIGNHVEQLPNDPSLDKLRQSATAFVKRVRSSTAAQSMSEAQAGLAEFSGTRGHENALAAADTLEACLSKCKGMGNQATACLGFQPKLNSCMGNTPAQLLSLAGLGQGLGGMAGYGMNQNTLQNVGLYGNLPLGAEDRSGQSKYGIQAGSHVRQGSEADRESSWVPRDSRGSAATGSASEAVPMQYRRRVGQYFQRIADEIGEHDHPRDK